MAYTPDFAKLLTPGSRYVGAQTEYVIEVHPLDDAVLPTGRVVGCDPLVYPEAEPYTTAVPPGTYPVRAWVAVLHQDGQEWQRRNAALQLVIREEPVVRWEPALTPEDDPGTLGALEFFGYPVDAGTGTLADVTALRALATWDYERVEDVFIPAESPEVPVPGAISAVTVEGDGANVITVTSGWGDGAYPTFVGLTADGEVATFVTDFMVVPA